MSSYEIEGMNVESWQTFLDNNQEIESALDRCCSNVADLIANANAVTTVVATVNEAFGNLKKVTISQVNDGQDFLNRVNELSNYFQESSVKIIATLKYAELTIKSIDSGEPIDEKAENAFWKLIHGGANWNVTWFIYEALKSSALLSSFSGLGFVLAYGADMKYDGSTFVIGDGVTALFGDSISQAATAKIPVYWINAGVGAVVVAGVSAVHDVVTDKGDWTTLDTKRLIGNATQVGLTYAEWTTIVGSVTAATGGTALPGVILAGIVAVPTTWLLSEAKGYFTGDRIIDEFTKDGVEYEVPYNGSGENGTYDAILSNYKDVYKEYTIGGVKYTENQYKDMLYNDWEKLFKLDQGRDINEEYSYCCGESSELREVMQEVAAIEDPDDAELYFYEWKETSASYGAKELIYELSIQYGFDIGDYVAITHYMSGVE